MDYELMMNGNVKIGQKAPNFKAVTTYGEIELNNYAGKWLIFFSHSGDFTPVCTTEMIEFAKAYPFFQKLNTELLGLSIDSNPSHLEWMRNIYSMTGIVLPFPIIADRNGSIARQYGMISNDVSSTETVRSVFILDDKGIVRVILTYPLNIGRYIPEIIRIVEALQYSEKSQTVIPANWREGDPTLLYPPKTYLEIEERMKNESPNRLNWYLEFK